MLLYPLVPDRKKESTRAQRALCLFLFGHEQEILDNGLSWGEDNYLSLDLPSNKRSSVFWCYRKTSRHLQLHRWRSPRSGLHAASACFECSDVSLSTSIPNSEMERKYPASQSRKNCENLNIQSQIPLFHLGLFWTFEVDLSTVRL